MYRQPSSKRPMQPSPVQKMKNLMENQQLMEMLADRTQPLPPGLPPEVLLDGFKLALLAEYAKKYGEF